MFILDGTYAASDLSQQFNPHFTVVYYDVTVASKKDFEA